jgi:hypothetical protein
MENYYLMYIYIPFGIVKKSSGYGQYWWLYNIAIILKATELYT